MAIPKPLSAAGSPARVGSQDFSRALLDPQADTPAGLIGPDGRTAPKRFNVYRNNVIVSLCEALGQSFPAVRTLLGEEYFNALARVFVIAHPPASPVLIWYGRDLADFIGTFPPLEAYPYLADVARVEWAWLQAYHAADAAPLDPSVLGTLAPDAVAEARFVRHPASGVISSKWPVLDLVRANRFETGTAEPVDLNEPQAVLVTRPDLDVGVLLLRPGADVFTEALFEGAALGEAAGLAQESTSEFSLADCLSDLLSGGAFTALQGKIA